MRREGHMRSVVQNRGFHLYPRVWCQNGCGFTAEALCDDVVDESDGTGHAVGQADGYTSAGSIEDGDTVSARSGSDKPSDVQQNLIMLQSTQPVMARDLQHPKLYAIYNDLPVLNQFRDVVLYGGRPNLTVERADFGRVIQGLPRQGVL
ncbi:hypothetical protein BD779DRAFT_236415 [Infundibulicybe gibba]|nr:hypothetical protein BD779DRAFT_236415 [Infundibulicybe gibba]